jgi:hypothetical protein
MSYISYIKEVLSEAPNQDHPHVKLEWRNDTFDKYLPY